MFVRDFAVEVKKRSGFNSMRESRNLKVTATNLNPKAAVTSEELRDHLQKLRPFWDMNQCDLFPPKVRRVLIQSLTQET